MTAYIGFAEWAGEESLTPAGCRRSPLLASAESSRLCGGAKNDLRLLGHPSQQPGRLKLCALWAESTAQFVENLPTSN
jgi:hypothetical protein